MELYKKETGRKETDNACEEEVEEARTLHDYTIDTEEIQRIIGKLKNRKTPGVDGITNELIKYGRSLLTKELSIFFNKILSAKKVPAQWKKSTTIPIFKKGTKTDTKNYRGISFLSTVQKLMTKIVAREIARTGISEEQQGFRQNRSTVDTIFILRQISEKAIKFNKPVFMCFVDLKQAFDRVRLQDVLQLLRARGINNKIVATIKELNTQNTTTIRTGNMTTKKIPMASGIRQGDSLSPILFNLIMDEIIKEVKTGGERVKLGRKGIKIICYADDAVITSEDEDDLQRMLYKFETTAKKFNMIISVQKTESLTISKEPRRCKLAVYNQSVNQVMRFKYLGVNITSNRNLREEVRDQTTKASIVSGYLRDIIWRNKYISIKSKIRIYKTCIRPIMTYAAETRAETTTTKRILRTTEMKTLQAITGNTLRDRRRNEDIRRDCETQDVVRWIRKRRREWRDHIDRMDDDRLPKVAKRGRPETARPPGRPPKRWYESWTSTSQE